MRQLLSSNYSKCKHMSQEGSNKLWTKSINITMHQQAVVHYGKIW